MRPLVGAVLALLGSTSFAIAAPRLPSAPAAPFTPGRVVVVAAPGSPMGALALGGPSLPGDASGRLLAGLGIARARSLRRATPEAKRAVEVLLLESDQPGFDPVAVARVLRAQPGVLGAAPDLHLRLDIVPNDPQFGQEWWLSTSAAAVYAQPGWERETGEPGAAIAIMDTGVDLGHEDLASKIWTNPGEIPGNGIDDDHDGYVDDVHGWDFGDADNDPDPEPMIDPTYGIDLGWHGTFVAGLAAAATNNAVGIAGIAWGCPIMPLKVSDAAGNITLTSVASAFDYAVAMHPAVLNMSFGAPDTSSASVFQALVNEAVAADIVCVAAAGNDGTDAPTYPADCDSVIAVASTNASNVRSSFSNWGPHVDMCAPGEGMWSTIARNYVYDDISQIYFEYLWGWDGVTPYMENDGTSFSAPIVSGAAALLRSLAPTITANDVARQLVRTGDYKLYDNWIGPKLDIDRALTNVLAVTPDAPAAGRLELAPAPNPAAEATTLRFVLPSAGPVRLAIYDASGRLVRVIVEGARASGAHALAWDLRSADGVAVRPGLYFARLETAGGRVTRRIAVLR